MADPYSVLRGIKMRDSNGTLVHLDDAPPGVCGCGCNDGVRAVVAKYLAGPA